MGFDIFYLLGLLGMWVFSDGVLSWTLYLNTPSYEGSKKQTFKRDHWVRLVRMLCGIAIMIIGAMLVG